MIAVDVSWRSCPRPSTDLSRPSAPILPSVILLCPHRYFPTILIVIMAVFNDGAMIALSKDRVVASRLPNSWNLKNIFIMGIVYGLYLTLSSWVLYQVAVKGTFFEDKCSLPSLNDRTDNVGAWCANLITNPATRNSVSGRLPVPTS